jgi:integrase
VKANKLAPVHPGETRKRQRAAHRRKWRLAGLKPGGRHGLSEGFKRIMRKAGLDLDTVQGKGVRQLSRRTFHALRRSFTSALANQGVAPELRMTLTGHKTEAVHRGYTHHELEKLRAAVGKIPPLH